MSEYIGEQIKAVFFDHDDTLVGTIDAKWAHHKQVAHTYYGKVLTDDEISEHWGKPHEELLGILYSTDNKEEAVLRARETHADFPKEIFAATVPTLKHIKAAGKLIGIVTATTRFSFEYDLDLHQVPRELIDYTQTADDTSYHKPDPRVFEPAIDWLKEQQIQADEVMYIGDGLHDMRAAVGAGFSFLGVETGLVTAKQFQAENAKSIPDVGSLIRGS